MKGNGKLTRRNASAHLVFSCLLLVVLAIPAVGGINPYSGIVERNSFGLKPPVNPADLVKPPPPVVADIKLQGITTILGRKQVLMKVRVPTKPPEPARDESLVLLEGQREGEVEVLEINPEDGTVKISNGGTILALNMQDHADKPLPGATPPGPAGAPPSGGVQLPSPSPATIPGVGAATGNRAIPHGAFPTGASVSTFGGGTGAGMASDVSGFGSTTAAGISATKFPSRTMRSISSPGSPNPQSGNEFQNISPEAQAILIEAQRGRLAPGGFDPLPKTGITPPRQQ